MTAGDNLEHYQDRLDYLEAQQRLLERDFRTTKLTLDDVANLEIILKRDLAKRNYTLNELEKLRLKSGRIYGRANVTSTRTSDSDSTRYHTATISFHTDHTFTTVFDSHKVGGDEWRTVTNNTVYALTYSAAKQRLYINGTEIYKTKAGNADTVLRVTFACAGATKECADFIDKYGHTRKDALYSINTKQTISNIKNRSNLPSCLDFIFTSFDKGKGIKIITEITDKDIVENNVDIELVDSWLASK